MLKHITMIITVNHHKYYRKYMYPGFIDASYEIHSEGIHEKLPGIIFGVSCTILSSTFIPGSLVSWVLNSFLLRLFDWLNYSIGLPAWIFRL